MAAGIPVVLASRVPSGRVAPAYGFPGGGARWIAAGRHPGGVPHPDQGAHRAGPGPRAQAWTTPAFERLFGDLREGRVTRPARLGRPGPCRAGPGRHARRRDRLRLGRGHRHPGRPGRRHRVAGGHARRSRPAHERLAAGTLRTWRCPGIVDAHLHLASAATRRGAAGPDVRTPIGPPCSPPSRPRTPGSTPRATTTAGCWVTAGRSTSWAPGRPLRTWTAWRPVAPWRSGPMTITAAGSAARRCRRPGSTATRPTRPAGASVGTRDGRPDGMLFEDAATLVDRAIPAPGRARLAADLAAYAATWHAWASSVRTTRARSTADPELRRGPTFYRALAAHGRLPLRVVACVREDQLEAAIAAGFRTGRGVRDARRPATLRGPGGPVPRRLAEAVRRRRAGLPQRRAAGAVRARRTPRGAPVGGPTGMLLRSPALRCSRAAPRQPTRHRGPDPWHRRRGGPRRPRRARRGCRGSRWRAAPRGACAAGGPRGHPAVRGDRVSSASVQPCHLISDARRRHAPPGATGRPARSRCARSLAAGATLAFGTDAPVEPADPWPGIAAAVIRGIRPLAGRTGRLPPRAGDRPPGGRSGRRPAGRPGSRGSATRAIWSRAPVPTSWSWMRPPSTSRSRRGGALERCRPLATLIDGEVTWRDPGFDA